VESDAIVPPNKADVQTRSGGTSVESRRPRPAVVSMSGQRAPAGSGNPAALAHRFERFSATPHPANRAVPTGPSIAVGVPPALRGPRTSRLHASSSPAGFARTLLACAGRWTARRATDGAADAASRVVRRARVGASTPHSAAPSRDRREDSHGAASPVVGHGVHPHLRHRPPGPPAPLCRRSPDRLPPL
jgi:hypothetical protein